MNGIQALQARVLPAALLAVTLAATALTLTTSPLTVMARSKQVTAVGTIVAAPEFSICQQGATQLLMDGDEVVYQLKSDMVKLDAFEGYRARVRGEALEPIEGCAPMLLVRGVRPLGPAGAYP